MARDELAVIKTVKIFKQQLYVRRKQRSRMVVDRMLQLPVYLVETIEEDFRSSSDR